MAIAAVGSPLAQALGPNGGTSSSKDTTGANVVVVGVSDYSLNALGTLSDSKSNTWHQLTSQDSGGNGAQKTRATLFYAINPTVGGGHTFTYTGSGVYADIFMLAYSGADTAAPFDVQNGAATTSVVSTFQPGSVTPGQDGEVVVALLTFAAIDTISVDSGLTIEGQVNYASGATVGGAIADLIETTATAKNPTFSWSTVSPAAAAVIATFKAAPIPFTLTLTSGSYALTGEVQSFDRGLMANFGSYVLTGEVQSFALGLLATFGSYALTGEPQTFTWTAIVTGVTRSCDGTAILPGCQVKAFATATDTLVGSATSDADGNYSIIVTKGMACYLVAYKAGSPDVAGTTRDDILGV